MNLSFTTMATPDHTAREAAALGRRVGYTGIDLRVSDDRGELSPRAGAGEVAALRRVLDGEGMTLAGLLCYNARQVDDAAGRAAMAEDIVRHLALAQALGSPSIRVFTSGTEGGTRPERIPAAAEAVATALLRHTGPERVLLQHHSGQLTALEAVDVLEQVGDRRAGLILSPDHCLLMGEDIAAVLARALPWVGQLYVADVRRTGAGYDCTLPGEGEAPLGESLQALIAAGFAGWVTFKWEKIWHPELPPAEAALPKFLEWVGRA